MSFKSSRDHREKQTPKRTRLGCSLRKQSTSQSGPRTILLKGRIFVVPTYPLLIGNLTSQSKRTTKVLEMKRDCRFLTMECILLAIIILWATVSQAQERSTILAGHGTLSGSILPLWVGAEAKLFEKHGLQVKPIYLPRAAGRPALLTGDIQIYFSAGPPLVQ